MVVLILAALPPFHWMGGVDEEEVLILLGGVVGVEASPVVVRFLKLEKEPFDL